MRRGVFIALAVGILFAGGAQASDVQQLNGKVLSLVTPLLEANSAQCGKAFDPLFAATDDPSFGRLPLETRRKVLTATVACSRRVASARAASIVRELEPLAASPSEQGDANEVLMEEAARRSDFPEASRRLIRLMDIEPARVARWWPPYLGQIVYGKGVSDDAALSLALFKGLTTLNWVDPDSRLAAQNGWARRYADLLADSGDLAGARAAMAKMDDAALWMEVAQDGRYRTLWPAFEAEGRFDWRKQTELELGQVMARRSADPAKLKSVYDVIQLLRQLQRYDDAIATGQTYRARIKAGEAFGDTARYGNWVLNELAYALLDVGRTAEAEEVFLESIEIGEHGSPSVSQRINWAEKLDILGRPREAMDILKAVQPEGASPYGKMWNDAEMVCALSQTGGDGLETLLASMRSRWDDNPAALTQALICADRPDEAAALYIRRLGSPKYRSGALEAFRIVRAPPFLTPRSAELERRRRGILARDDVQKAMLAVGRGIDLPLAGAYWGSM